MPAVETTKVVQSDESMRLHLLAQVDVLNHHMATIAAGINAARQAGAIFAQLEKHMKTFAEELDRLTKSVAGITGVVPGVVATLGDIAGKFKANSNDPQRIGQLADELDAAKVKLANAVVSGTVAADEAPAVPAEEPKPAEQPAPPADGTDGSTATGDTPAPTGETPA